jgi:oligopeptide/dipeptide ABC transporter ATP-binding protein
MERPSSFIVEARALTKQFLLPRERLLAAPRRVTAVDDVSFAIPPATTLGIVGESGSGKTTVAKMLLKLEKPTSGALLHDGLDIASQDREQERAYRRSVQAVLQDPYGALSPRLQVGMIVAEPMIALGERSRRDALQHARHMLEVVGLHRDAADRYPHQFSGGQRQRIAIARALSINPRIVVLDEPVSALDVSIRAQVLQLLKQMQGQFGITYLFIGHDLMTVRFMSDIVGVMYFGRMVELAPARELFRRPLHPYTRKLVALAASEERITASSFQGELPNPLAPPGGCSFHTRCPFATPHCSEASPALRSGGDGDGRTVACHYFEEIDAGAKEMTGPLPQERALARSPSAIRLD